jgi:hypothetical protein
MMENETWVATGQVEETTAETLMGKPEDCRLEITHQIFYMSGALLYSANQGISTTYIMKNFHS